MNPFLMFLISLLMKIGRKTWAQLLEMYDTFMDFISEASFGMFIAWCGNNLEGMMAYHEYHTKLLRSFFYFCNPVFIYAYNPDQYKNDEAFRWFIRQDPYLFAIFEQAVKLREEKKETNSTLDFLSQYLKFPPFNYMLAILELMVQNVETFITEIAYFWYNLYNNCNKDPKAFLDAIAQNFTTQNIPILMNIPSMQLAVRLNPLLPYEYASLLAHIHIIYSYSKVIESMKTPAFPPDFYNKLQARLFFDGKPVRWTRPSDDGKATFIIPKEEYEKLNPKYIEIRFLGLKPVMGIFPHGTIKLYVRNTKQTIYFDDPTYTVWNGLPDGWVEIAFEDMKGVLNPDWDFDDAILRFKTSADVINWQVWHGEHAYTNEMYVNDVLVAVLNPKGDRTPVKVSEGYWNTATGEVVITWKAW